MGFLFLEEILPSAKYFFTVHLDLPPNRKLPILQFVLFETHTKVYRLAGVSDTTPTALYG
jgi:hypothetical protein